MDPPAQARAHTCIQRRLHGFRNPLNLTCWWAREKNISSCSAAWRIRIIEYTEYTEYIGGPCIKSILMQWFWHGFGMVRAWLCYGYGIALHGFGMVLLCSWHASEHIDVDT